MKRASTEVLPALVTKNLCVGYVSILKPPSPASSEPSLAPCAPSSQYTSIGKSKPFVRSALRWGRRRRRG